MSVLFTVEGRMVAPRTEVLLIPPFKDIWERDGTELKELAKQEFAYIEFMTSVKDSNPYAGYDEKEKHDKIAKDIMPENWMPDEFIIQGMRKILEFQKEASFTYTYFMAAKSGGEKMKDFFLKFDLNERNARNGNPVYKPREITAALNDTNKVLESFAAMKEKVEAELFESSRKKGGKTIGHFAKISSL